MSKQPYFTTADGIEVDEYTSVFVIIKGRAATGIFSMTCQHAKEEHSEKDIFSTRAAAQAECDKRNVV